MDLKSWGKLLIKIERTRRELYRISESEPENKEKLIQASQRLDKLIVKYQQVKNTLLISIKACFLCFGELTFIQF